MINFQKQAEISLLVFKYMSYKLFTAMIASSVILLCFDCASYSISENKETTAFSTIKQLYYSNKIQNVWGYN